MVGVNGCNGDSAQLHDSVDPNDIFVIRRSVSSGKESENPAREGKVCFYYKNSKGEPAVGPPVNVDLRLPGLATTNSIFSVSFLKKIIDPIFAKHFFLPFLPANPSSPTLDSPRALLPEL